MIADWAKWIHASVSKYLADNVSTYKFYFDGDDTDSGDDTLWATVQISGPDVTELNINNYKLDLEIAFVITNIVGNELYKIHELKGYCTALLTREIAVYKYGETGNPIWECLVRDGKVQVVDYNSPGNNKLLQCTVRANYSLNTLGG